MAGKLGRKAGHQTWPENVTITTASDVGTSRPYAASAAASTAAAAGVGGAASLAWSLPAGSAQASSYTITTTPSTYTKTVTGATSTTFEGLASNTAYTFTVKADNSVGSSSGTTSSSVTATTVPQAPTIGTATNSGSGRAYNNGLATVAYTAGADGGKAVSTFTATASSGGYTGTGSSPINVTGLQSATSYTFTVTATNANGTSAASSASGSITATTVPATPGAPSASSPSAGTDTVSWSAPATGGSAITNYYWTSSDGKSGNTGTSTSVNVAQEMGTAQTYNVRADNANGSSGTSANSGSVTTTFSFVPFGFTPFGFTPFSFTPFGAFGFTPFGFTPFGAFGFAPFGFTPFGAFGAFSFTPMFGAFVAFVFSPSFSFAPMGGFAFYNSISILTEVLIAGVPGSSKTAGELQVGDTLLALDIPNPSNVDWIEWQANSSELDLSSANRVETQIVALDIVTEDEFVYIDGDLFSKSHYVLVEKNQVIKFIKAVDVDTSYKIFSPDINSFVDISLVEMIYMNLDKVSINCEPYDNFFTTKMLIFDRPDTQQ